MSDDQEWVEEAFAVGIRVGTHPEVVTWRRASELRLPLAFILADVDHGVENQEPVLWRWARLGLQPITILSLSPRIQVSETAHRFRQLGYDRFVFPSPSLRPTSEYWDLVVAEIERTQSVLTFIPLAMQVLDRHDPLLVRGLQILCCDFSIRTVHEWSRQLNLPLAKLRAELRQRELPPPKRTLEAFRISRAIYSAAAEGLTRAEAARRYFYANGAYLGKTTKLNTGYAFGTLVRMGSKGVSRALEAMLIGCSPKQRVGD